jgi:hypothetical protein
MVTLAGAARNQQNTQSHEDHVRLQELLLVNKNLYKIRAILPGVPG